MLDLRYDYLYAYLYETKKQQHCEVSNRKEEAEITESRKSTNVAPSTKMTTTQQQCCTMWREKTENATKKKPYTLNRIQSGGPYRKHFHYLHV